MSTPAVLRGVRLFLDVAQTTGPGLVPALLHAFQGRVERDDGASSGHTTELVQRYVYAADDAERFAQGLQAQGTALLLSAMPYSRYQQVLSPEHVIVFLREPVGRVAAHWEAACAAGEFHGSIVDFARSPKVRNLQARMLHGAPLRRLGFLGSSEHYATSVARLTRVPHFAALAVELGREGPAKPAYQPTASERIAIREANAKDVGLYERAAFSPERQTLLTRLVGLFRPQPRPKREAASAKKERQRRARRAAERHSGPYAQGVLPLVSKERQLAVLFTQKAGCTFAVKWFFEQIGLLEEATSYSEWIHDYREQVFYGSEGYRPEDIAAPTMRVVKFVRNPFTRAVSSYVQASKLGYEDAKLQRFLGRAVTRERRYSFREFVDYLGSLDLRTCNVHHRLQVHPLEAIGLVRVTHMVPIERSHTLLPELEQRLELTLTDTARLAASVHHTTRALDQSFCGDEPLVLPRGKVTLPHADAFYDGEIERAVARSYREDFERYGYPARLQG